MFTAALSSHEVLQKTADDIAAFYQTADADVLHFALVEVLQNVVQHGNGFCVIELRERAVVVCNTICDESRECSHIGLRMLSGVEVERRGNIFRATIPVDEIAFCLLDLDEPAPIARPLAC